MQNSGRAEPQLGINWASESWKSRGYLPHYDSIGSTQSIAFRLADSLPQSKLSKIEEELKDLSEDKKSLNKRIQIEKWLDAGYGCCALSNFEVASIMQETLLKFHDEKYQLIAWCIMPNHVHVLIKSGISLGRIVQSWKSYTARWAIKNNERLNLNIPGLSNAELGLGVPGKFWMREYWDRFIRDESHYNSTISYIHHNPVKAGLCSKIEDWLWSSAHYYEDKFR